MIFKRCPLCNSLLNKENAGFRCIDDNRYDTLVCYRRAVGDFIHFYENEWRMSFHLCVNDIHYSIQYYIEDKQLKLFDFNFYKSRFLCQLTMDLKDEYIEGYYEDLVKRLLKLQVFI